MEKTPNHNQHHGPCIEFSNVTFTREGEPVLKDISFHISHGDYVGIVGPNGSGKTTLVRLMLGLLTPTAGKVRIFGEPVHYFKDAAWIGYVPQRVSQTNIEFPATAEEVVRTGRTAKVGVLRRFRTLDHDAVERAMKITGVTEFKHRLIGSLSGGQRQRAFLARALASEPKILILDEPTVGVDVAAQEIFYSFLKRLNEEMDMTIIFVSHDIDIITHEAKHILCVNRELVCHVPSKEFIHADHLRKLFGDKGRYIAHGH